jgi:competence protein ComEC
MKQPLGMVALVFAGGILAGDLRSLPLGWLFSICFLLLGAALLNPEWRPRLLLVLIFFAGWTHHACRTAVISPVDLRKIFPADTSLATVRGSIQDSPKHRIVENGGIEAWRSMALVSVEAVRLREGWQPAHGTIAVSTPGALEFSRGQRLEVNGVLKTPPGPLAPGLFDYRSYLKRQGIHYQLITASTNDWVPIGLLQSPFSDRFIAWAQRTLARGLPEDQTLRLRWAMTLGWRAALTDEVSEKFMRSGTMHIFAISGLHIGLIAGILVVVFRVARVPRRMCGAAVIPMLWFYAVATGWQPSAVRATIMMSVIIAGWALARPGNLLNSLAAAACIILAWDPQQLFQVSFQLSFFVVLSIALVMPVLERRRDRLLEPDPLLPPELRARWRRWLDVPLRYLLGSLALSLAAWLGSLPLIAHYFNLFTPVALIANVFIVLLSALALMSNLGSLFCGAWWPWGSELFNFSGTLWMDCMIGLSRWFGELPGASWHVRSPSAAGCALYYVFLFSILTGSVWTARKKFVGGFGAVALAVSIPWQWMQERNSVTITILPLQGGEAVFVNAPGRRNDLLVDCGNTRAMERVTKPFLRSQGLNRLPRLALTHGDIKNVGGAREFLESFPTDEVLTGPVSFRSPAYRQVMLWLEGTDAIANRTVARGDRIGAWTVLHPDPADRFSSADDLALVLHGEVFGSSILLLSDLGRAGQMLLLARYPDLRADIVVTGLPSQREPLGPALLRTLQPRAIIVTDTETPATERASTALRERLAQEEIPVFYCRDAGALTIALRSGKWRITPSLGSETAAHGRTSSRRVESIPEKHSAPREPEAVVQVPEEDMRSW